MGRLGRFKPRASRRTLLLLAGLLWIGVGTMLLALAAGWLGENPESPRLLLVAVGVTAALFVHHFGFLRVVDKNLGRILPMEGARCAFSFLSWKSYLTVLVMMGLGLGLRHSPVPKPYLAALYIAIGLGLVLSSLRYLRVLRGLPRDRVW